MIIKQDINWRTEEPPYKDLKDGQLLLICLSRFEVHIYEWGKEYSAFCSIDDFTLEPKEWKENVEAWAYYEYPGKEAE